MDDKNTLKVNSPGTICLISVSPGMEQKYILDAFNNAGVSNDCIFTDVSLSSAFYGKKISTMNNEHSPFITQRKLTNKSIERAALAICDLRSIEGQITVIVDTGAGNDKTREKFAELAEENGVDFKLVVGKGTPEQARKSAIDKGEMMAVVGDRYNRYTAETKFDHTVLNPNFKVEINYNKLDPNLKIDVIGDVHGMYDELTKVLDKKGYIIKDETINHPQGRIPVFLGDLTDRGPKSVEILKLVKNTVEANKGYLIKGNHEQMLIDGFESAGEFGGITASSISSGDTIAKMLRTEDLDCKETINFLKKCPSYLIYKDTLITHANIEHFNPFSTANQHLMNGDLNHERLDTDASYQKLKEQGYNQYNLLRGHCRETSKNPSVASIDYGASAGGSVVLTDLTRACELCEIKGMMFREAIHDSVISVHSKYDHRKTKIHEKELYKTLKSLENEGVVNTVVDHEKGLTLFKASDKTRKNRTFFSHDELNRATGICLSVDGRVAINPPEFIGEIGDDVKYFDKNKDIVYAKEPRGFLINVARAPYGAGLIFTTSNSFDSKFTEWSKDIFHRTGVYDKINKFLGQSDNTLTFKIMHEEHTGSRFSKEEMAKGADFTPVLISAKRNQSHVQNATLSPIQLINISKTIGAKSLEYKKGKFEDVLNICLNEKDNYFVKGINKNLSNNFEDESYKMRSLPQLIQKFTNFMTKSKVEKIVESKGNEILGEHYIYRLAIKNSFSQEGIQKMKTIDKEERAKIAEKYITQAYYQTIKEGMDLDKQSYSEKLKEAKAKREEISLKFKKIKETKIEEKNKKSISFSP